MGASKALGVTRGGHGHFICGSKRDARQVLTIASARSDGRKGAEGRCGIATLH
ncbi:hypothetical protein KIF59_00595 [Enterobacter cloacae subsp. cloacae]|nr:hypothetical protein [Enterobacter cloacae subsp. cloacae]